MVVNRSAYGPSSAVRNNEDCPRTKSDTPSQVSRRPPSLAGSTRRTSHSSSRTTIRAPGAIGVCVTVFLAELASLPVEVVLRCKEVLSLERIQAHSALTVIVCSGLAYLA